MFSTARVAISKFAMPGAAVAFMLLMTSCGRNQLSLTIAQAASKEARTPTEIPAAVARARAPRAALVHTPASNLAYLDVERTTQEMYKALPTQSCYAYMLRRPSGQRATAVQARLLQADHLSAALDSDTFSVNLEGDHANVLSLEFPVAWPAMPAYSAKVSAEIVDYFSVPEIHDNLCNSGFSQVKLSARDTNDGQKHAIWTARVTTEGLVRLTADGKRERLGDFLTAP